MGAGSLPILFTADVWPLRRIATMWNRLARDAAADGFARIADCDSGSDAGRGGNPRLAEDRAKEAAEAAQLLGVSWRQALDLPDGAVANTLENRSDRARAAPLAPARVILPYWQARIRTMQLRRRWGMKLVFLLDYRRRQLQARLVRMRFRCTASAVQDCLREFICRCAASFVVDITTFIEQRHAALMAYRSQYANQKTGSGLFVAEEEIRERTFAEARHYGLLAGVKYGEPFQQKEVGLVDDLTLIPVQSI